MSNNLFIFDGQDGSRLGHIHKSNVLTNEHEKDLPTHKDIFRFTALGDKNYAAHLGKRNLIIAPGEDGELLEFRIFESQLIKNAQGSTAHVYTRASFLDIKRTKVFDPGKTNAETAESHANIALANTGWQVGNIDFKGTRTLEFDRPYNPYDYIKRIAREFELEMKFYVTHDGSKITGRYLDLVDQIGEWRGRTVEFGRDLGPIERREKTNDLVTALWIYGPEREDGSRLKVFVEDDDARQRWGKNGEHLVDYHEPITENEDITEERLTTLGNMELNKRIDAIVSYRADIVDLENVPGLENKKIRFGDTIEIKDKKFNPPLYLEARIFNQKRDVFVKSNKRVELGDYIEYTEEEVNAIWKQFEQQIRDRLEKLVLVTIVSSAGNVFKNGIGSTELSAKTFLSGHEVDEDGTKYEYRWHKFDKDGNYAGFSIDGKSITVTASSIDEKASYRVEVILNDEVLTLQEITLSNVFDGEDGEQGPEGPQGEDGKDGYTPIKGVDYFDGVDGQDGEDGSSSYLWVRYSQNANGNPMTTDPTNAKYIGVATTTTASAPPSYTAYQWSLVKGTDGIAGEDGEDGRTSYLHIKYSNDGGQTFTANNGETVGDWIGTYVDFTQADSNNVNTYTWNKVKGDKGDQGIQGPPGTNGQSQYVHIRWSANANGNPMTTTPQSTSKYIGLANTTSPTAPTSYTAYTWALIKGDDGQPGIPGQPGADGTTTYTWVKYADTDTGAGMSDSPINKLYIGLAFNKTTPTESNNASDYTWSLMPQNIEIGGRNLVLNSKEKVTNSAYPTKVYNLSETSVIGETYTYQIKGKLANDQHSWLFYSGGTHWGMLYQNEKYDSVNDIYHGTFTATRAINSISVYAFPNSDLNASIDWVKLERGNVKTDYYQAPEDVQAEIDRVESKADNAQASADGKNANFRQTSQPSTSNRRIGDKWFKINSNGITIAMYTWTGSWTEDKLDAETFSVGKLSAISADLGNVTAGSLTAVDIKSSSTIDVATDLRVGDDIYLSNADLREGGKGVHFHGNLTSIVSRLIRLAGQDVVTDLLLKSQDNIVMDAPGTLIYEDLKVLGTIETQYHANLSLLAGWQNYGSSFQGARVTKNADSFVYLSGVIAGGTIGAVTAAILPVGCRPRAIEMFSTLNAQTGTVSRIYVYPNGDVQVRNGDSNNFVSLSGIVFRGEN